MILPRPSKTIGFRSAVKWMILNVLYVCHNIVSDICVQITLYVYRCCGLVAIQCRVINDEISIKIVADNITHTRSPRTCAEVSYNMNQQLNIKFFYFLFQNTKVPVVLRYESRI